MDFQTALKALVDQAVEKKLAELLNLTPKPAAQAPVVVEEAPQGRRKRSTREDVENNLASIIELLGQHPGGLRSELLRQHLPQLDKRDVANATKLGLESHQLKSKGQKRATTYLLPSAAQAQGRVKKRTAKG